MYCDVQWISAFFVCLSSLFLVVWCTVMFSLDLHGRRPPTERPSWTVFPSPTLHMSRPCWSCFDISAPSTPCWGAVSPLRVSEQVGDLFIFLHHDICEKWTTSGRKNENVSVIRCFFFFDGSVCDLHHEVLPESETSFSVTFHRPDSDSLAVCEH